MTWTRPGATAASAASGTDTAAATAPDLDLAFSVGGCCEGDVDGDGTGLGDGMGAGPLADPLAGEERWRDHLGRWLAELAPELAPPLRASSYSLGLALTDDSGIAALNAQWRHHEGPTDVLAFAAQEGAPPGAKGTLPPGAAGEPLELGDIVISLDTAARQAAGAGHTLEEELLFLASHGLLHLLGWDHPDEASLTAMLERQERLLAGP